MTPMDRPDLPTFAAGKSGFAAREAQAEWME
jgi:hypothetical protein